MNRTVRTRLNKVQPIPASLRAIGGIDFPAERVEVNLGQLFQHYYFDSYGPRAPSPDPSRFEYLQLVSAEPDFRFLPHLREASLVKRRALSTEMGQAFCRWMLHEHFSIRYFAHMSEVLEKPTHAAFEGMRIERLKPGDVPDYLCARKVTKPFLAEAKGRFSAVGFDTAEFQRWRDQFDRVHALNRAGDELALKGYIVATRLTTVTSKETPQTTIFTEDPETHGIPIDDDGERGIGRVIVALHYARVFRKLDFRLLAACLENGFPLAPELTFAATVWTCSVSPFLGSEFVGGFYQTDQGLRPQWQEDRWLMPPELGRGHAAFVGLRVDIAQHVARAARGDWASLDGLADVNPEGGWSSEFSWLRDGTVLAPLEYFRPTRIVPL